MNKDQVNGFGIGLLAGLLIGGTLALLYAPQSGKETREMVKQKAMLARDRAEDVAEDVKEFASHSMEKVKSKLGGMKRPDSGSEAEING